MPARTWWLLPLLLLLPACSSTRNFAPREGVNGSGPSGAPAALYPLGDATGRRGELRLWSDGARAVKVDGQKRTRVHIGFELENFTDQPLQLDPDSVRLQGMVVGGQVRDGQLAPVQVAGTNQAAPGQTARWYAWFEPGSGVRPRDIGGFEVHWRVQQKDGSMAFEQATPFQPFSRHADWDSYPCYPCPYPYQPYPWGWGWGWGWGYGHPYWGYPYHGWHHH